MIIISLKNRMNYSGGVMDKKKKWNLFDEENWDIYDEEYIEELLDGDEISSEEQAFMRGYNNS